VVQICKFCENLARDTPCGAFIFHVLSNLSKKIQFLGSYTLVVAPMGVKFGTEEGTLPSYVPNFTPIDAMCGPCGAKNLKIGL